MDAVGHAYRAVAEQYIQLFGSAAAVDTDDLALIGRHLSSRAGAVLDVGCGPGHITAHLRSLGVDTVGIDLVPEFIAHARAMDAGGRFTIASMHQLPVPDGSAAGVLSWYSLIHMPSADLDAALAELRRVLVPGGTLVVGFFEGDELEAFEHRVATAYHRPVDELSARMQRAGFEEMERHRRPGVPEPGRRPHAILVALAS